MKRFRFGGRNQPHPGLSVAELANRLPNDIRDSTRQWLFDDLPLRLPELPSSAETRRQAPAESVLRFSGVITSLDHETGNASIRPFNSMPDVGLSRAREDLRLDARLGEYGKKLAALEGLILDMSVRFDDEPGVSSFYRAASLLTVYGIERQVIRGDRRGVLRGEITSINHNSLGHGIYGCEVVSEADTPFSVKCNPSNNNDPKIWAEGNTVALRVDYGGPTGEFMQDRLPDLPLRHSVLLQPAVPQIA